MKTQQFLFDYFSFDCLKFERCHHFTSQFFIWKSRTWFLACLYTTENTLRQQNRAVPWPPRFCCEGSSATATRQSSSPASAQGRWTFSWRHRALPKPAGHGAQWRHPDPSEPPTSELGRGPTKPHRGPGEERHNGLTLTDTWTSCFLSAITLIKALFHSGVTQTRCCSHWHSYRLKTIIFFPSKRS